MSPRRGAIFRLDSKREVLFNDRPLFSGDASQLLEAFTQARAAGGKHLVMTLNVDQVLNLRTDPRFRAVYADSSFRTVDGMPILAISRALGASRVERITGADLLPTAVEQSDTGLSVAICGGTSAVLSEAGERLRAKFPHARLSIIPMEQVDAESAQGDSDCVTAEVLRELSPDIVFICLGSPKQELWFERMRDSLPEGIYVGAGAAVDFAAGAVSRAPSFVQRLGAEWMWRLVHEPRRLWRRYLLRGPLILWVAAESLVGKLRA